MKKIQLLIAILFFTGTTYAQMDLPPSGGNPRATITEEVGITSITIKYSRPDVNKREGKIWGDGNIVPYGFSTQNNITNKNTSPWRAGANENTIITFEHEVKIEGQSLKAGAYGLSMAMGADNVILIFSTSTSTLNGTESFSHCMAITQYFSLCSINSYFKYSTLLSKATGFTFTLNASYFSS